MILHVFTSDVSITPQKLLEMLSAVKFWGVDGLLVHLGVPVSVVEQIKDSQSYTCEEEKRLAGLQYYLNTVPGASWASIASVLWQLEEHSALTIVRQYLPPSHGKLK